MFKNKDKIDSPPFSLQEDDTKYITLKEASEISEYAPDYIGQLIRTGKIKGRQIYSNVAWVTTEEAVRAYMEGRGKEAGESEGESFIGEKGPELARWLLLSIIAVSALFLMILLYIFAVNLDHRLSKVYTEEAQIDI